MLLQVDKIKAVWGESIGFALGSSRDHRDIYNRQLQLYESHDRRCQRVKLYQPMRSSQDVDEGPEETARLNV